jgi:hypothetical protein
MKIYSPDNMTISVMDNASNSILSQNLNLRDYDISYSYYSDDGKFTRVKNQFDVLPFRDNMVTRIELHLGSQERRFIFKYYQLLAISLMLNFLYCA